MIIDAHTKIYPPSFQERRDELCRRDRTFNDLFSSPKARLARAEDLLRSMDKHGIQASVVAGIGWTDEETAREANGYLLESADRHKGRLIPFCSVNPAWGQTAVKEVKRCAGLGARGVGELHPDTQGLDITNKSLMSPFMEAARDLGLAVLIHASEPVGHIYPGKGRTTPDKLLAFIENFPDNVIVCAHWGGGLPFYALMPEVKEALARVYFDSAASPYLYRPEVFQHTAELVGPEKVLFASDYPVLSPNQALDQVEESGLSPEDRGLLLGGNARRLFLL